MNTNISTLSLQVSSLERECKTVLFLINEQSVKDMVMRVVSDSSENLENSSLPSAKGIVDTDFEAYLNTFRTGSPRKVHEPINSNREGYAPLLGLCKCCDTTCGGYFTKISLKGNLVIWSDIFFWNPSFFIGPDVIIKQTFTFHSAEYEKVLYEALKQKNVKI